LERASARETTVRVAAGGLAKCLLLQFGIEVFGFVRQVGEATADIAVNAENWKELLAKRD
jgi:chorismate synthase